MAKKRILIEGENLMLPHGTGIASYSRQVVKAVNELGYIADLLIKSNNPLTKSGGAANNIRVESPPGNYSRWKFPTQNISFLRGLHAFPWGIDVSPLDLPASKKTGGQLGRLDGFESGFAAHELYDISRQHAIRWGRPMPLTLPAADHPDLMHCMQTLPMRVPGRPWIVTMHDIIPLVLPESITLNLRHYRMIAEAVVRHADHIITVSEHSKRDLVQVIGADPNRVSNIYQAVGLVDPDDTERNSDVAGDLDFYQLEPQEYFLFAGAIEPKKNVRRLIEAFDGSRVTRPLVLVGGLGWDYAEALEAVKKPSGIRLSPGPNYVRSDHIRRLPYVARSQLISLIKGARAVLFPSLYEGFGLPVAEAMALGTPVMTSDCSSLPEIAGDATLMVNPTDVVGMAKTIKRLDEDADLRAELSKKGYIQAQKFSPKSHREQLDAIYRKFL